MKVLKGVELVHCKEKLSLHPNQRNIIVGTLLGDATLSALTSGIKTCNIKFDQSVCHSEYISHLYNIFKDWCGTEPRVRNITGGGAKPRQSISFKSYRHPSFLFYYGQFYKLHNGKRKKVVPQLLHKWLNDQVLAYWFMDDGGKDKYGYTLHTENYEYHEQVRMAKLLGEKFGFQVSIHRDKAMYQLYITASSRQAFTRVVSPYVVDCFRYKLHTD